ncbi:MAG: FAD-binding oxidoreductase [Candidatus Eremiobacteraeota bacterium]|nr:FAD-binding oxidoreductase [Candidatus Eremiobacteraeota bacterium]
MTIFETPPARVFAPNSIEELAEVVRAGAADNTALAPIGAATHLTQGNPPSRYDAAIRTLHLDRIIEYSPEDQVVVVEAGITLDAVQAALREHGQWLAIDPPGGGVRTIGGLLATNAFGPRRLKYGTLKDLIVGIEIVRADGARARGGGKVVKNVAGFDLPKLMVGALGTLGLIATATFKLHPLPEAMRWYVRRGLSANEVRAEYVRFVRSQLEPSAILAEYENGEYVLYVLFEGFAAGVEVQGVALGNDYEVAADDKAAHADLTTRTFGDVRVRISLPPAAFAALESDVLAPLRAAYDRYRLVTYPAAGVAFIGGYASEPERLALALNSSRYAADTLGGNLVMLECTDPIVRGRVDPFGALPPSFRIMERLKAQFDPERRLNRGRFVGGL